MKTTRFLAPIITIFACCLMSCNPTEPEALSQDVYLSRSFKWKVEQTVEDGISSTTDITIGKDTMINSRTYRLIDNYYPMRQTENRIYMYDFRTKEEILLYDFSLQVGDVIQQQADPFGAYPARDAKVVKTETITLSDGRKARKIEYEQTFPASRGSDIEFVGKETGGILGVLDNSMKESRLIGFYENEILLYP